MSLIKFPDTAFASDPDRRATRGRVENKAHLKFIRRLPCLSCGRGHGVEAAHVRYGDAEHGKGMTAAFRKPDDVWTVPLCAACHRTGPDAQHNSNERKWWIRQGVDPLRVAKELAQVTGDEEAGRLIVVQARFMLRE